MLPPPISSSPKHALLSEQLEGSFLDMDSTYYLALSDEIKNGWCVRCRCSRRRISASGAVYLSWAQLIVDGSIGHRCAGQDSIIQVSLIELHARQVGFTQIRPVESGFQEVGST